MLFFEFIALGVWYDHDTCSTFVSSESVFNTTCQHGALLHCKQGNLQLLMKVPPLFLVELAGFFFCFGCETLWVLLTTSSSPGSFRSSPVWPLEVLPRPGRALRCTLTPEQFSFITDLKKKTKKKRLFSFPTFSRTISRRGEVLFFKSFGVWVFEPWMQISSALIQSWSAKGLNSGTSQTAWNPVISENFPSNCCVLVPGL